MFKVYDKTYPTTRQMWDYFRTREEAEEAVEGREAHYADGTVLRGFDYLGIEEIERESRPCVYCGAEVQSESANFCRGCFYSGRSQAEKQPHAHAILRSLPGVDPETVAVWHTGGGCFSIGAALSIDGKEYEILVGQEDFIPEEENAPLGFSIGNDDGLWWGCETAELIPQEKLREAILTEIEAIQSGKPGS